MRTIGAKEQRIIEDEAAAVGTSASVLMERAGRALAERILRLLDERGGGPVSILWRSGQQRRRRLRGSPRFIRKCS